MADIFLCYARADSVAAQQVCQALRNSGWTVFMDVQTRVGERWHKSIERELHAAQAVVVLWSAASRESDFVLEEAEYGKRKGILFPAFIERTEFPYGFGRIQTADLVGWRGDVTALHWQGMLEALRGHLARAAPTADHSEPQVSTTRPSPPTPPDPPAPAFLALPAPGTTFRDALKSGGEGPLMVVLPPGKFLMGSPENEPGHRDRESPQHEVVVAPPFAIGAYAVTFEEYDRYARAVKCPLPDDSGWGRGRHPVINVSWDDAQAYVGWLSRETGRPYGLPSEAQWEYACRAGTTTPFHFGDLVTTDQANFHGAYPYRASLKGRLRARTLTVGSLPPNAFALHEMHGNVSEWCQDRWHDDYTEASKDAAPWESGDVQTRVLRGGSWNDLAGLARSAARDHGVPEFRDYSIGFRVVCSSPIE